MTGAEARRTTRRFAAVLYRSAPAGSLVEVRFAVASDMRGRFHRVAEIDGVVDTVSGLARRTDVFVDVLPRRRRGGRRDDLVEHASVLWLDCDSDESVGALAAFRPRPAILVCVGQQPEPARLLDLA